MKKLSILFAALTMCAMSYATTDILTSTTIGSPTSYTDFDNIKVNSNALYAGNAMTSTDSESKGAIQMSSKKNSGIVSTTSGGVIKKISITIPSGKKQINVYGSNTAYSASTNLYDSLQQGTLLGSLTGTGTIEVEGNYTYVGVRSNSGAVYLTNISFEWEDAVDTTLSGIDYSVDFSTESGYNTWKADNKSIGELTSVWTQSSTYGAKASAYVNKTNNAAEAWLISPVLDLSEAEVTTMTINHALNHLYGNACPLKIMGTKDGKNWEELTISAWPAGSSWIFEDATVDLTSVISATTQVALVYISTTTVAPTWEVKTVSIKGSKSIHATAITLNKTTSSIEQYKRDTLTATLTPAEASDAIVWTSADESIATVKNGVVTAIGMGTTDITATAGTVTATCVVTVTDAKPITIAEAVEIAQTVTKNNEIAAGGQYVIRGYVTALQGTPSDDMTKYGNYSVWLADSVNGGKVFEAYAVAPVDGKTIAAVGDYVKVIGDITKYYNSKSETTTYETAKGGSIKVLQDPTTAVENTTTKAVKTKKVIENGQLIIIDANGVRYNAVGVVIE